jgi:hypothetical protein
MVPEGKYNKFNGANSLEAKSGMCLSAALNFLTVPGKVLRQ